MMGVSMSLGMICRKKSSVPLKPVPFSGTEVKRGANASCATMLDSMAITKLSSRKRTISRRPLLPISAMLPTPQTAESTDRMITGPAMAFSSREKTRWMGSSTISSAAVCVASGSR